MEEGGPVGGHFAAAVPWAAGQEDELTAVRNKNAFPLAAEPVLGQCGPAVSEGGPSGSEWGRPGPHGEQPGTE